jgi:hypothetical protein
MGRLIAGANYHFSDSSDAPMLSILLLKGGRLMMRPSRRLLDDSGSRRCLARKPIISCPHSIFAVAPF